MEASGSIFIVGVEEHLQGLVLDVRVAHDLLGDGLAVVQLLLHLQRKHFKTSNFIRRTSTACARPLDHQSHFVLVTETGRIKSGGWGGG